MKLIMKFGGTSIADGEKLRHVAELVKSYYKKGNQVVVVTSALGGVTDDILKEAHKASKDGKVSRVKEFIADLTKQHHAATNDALGNNRNAEDIIAELDARIDETENARNGIYYLGELTLRYID